MKIKRFNEAEQADISSERVNEIVDNLKDFASLLNDKSKLVESLTNELVNFQSDSKKGNDQIDDSISALQVTHKSILESIDKIDTVVSNLSDYNQSGRKYLYSENK